MEVQKKTFFCHSCGDPITRLEMYPFCSEHCQKREEKMTKCWFCKRASGKCSWSAFGKPVRGWTAKKTRIAAIGSAANENGYIESYRVIECPKFKLIPCRQKTETVSAASFTVDFSDVYKNDKINYKEIGRITEQAYKKVFSGMIAQSNAELLVYINIPYSSDRPIRTERLCKEIAMALAGTAYPVGCKVRRKKYASSANRLSATIRVEEKK